MRYLVAVTLVVVSTVACGTDASPPSPPAAPPPGSSTPPPGQVSLGVVLDAVQAAGATEPVITTPDTDPVHLQGRPGQYTERATFALPGGNPTDDRVQRGGVIEIWPDPAGADSRSRFILDTLKATPLLGTEWHYVHGHVLVRVWGEITKTTADRIGAAVAALP